MRLRRALELLISQCDADGGHLFFVRDQGVECVATVGEHASSLELAQFADSVRRMDQELDEGVTAADLGLDDDVTRWDRWTSEAGASYDPVLLPGLQEASEPVGVAILRPRGGTLRQPNHIFIAALVRALAETGDLPVVRPEVACRPPGSPG